MKLASSESFLLGALAGEITETLRGHTVLLAQIGTQFHERVFISASVFLTFRCFYCKNAECFTFLASLIP